MDATRWIVVVADDAEQDRHERAAALVEALGDQAVLRTTDEPDDLAAAARQAAEAPATLVLVGGDGAVHLAAGVLAEHDLLDDVVLGVLPSGTGDDLAATLGLPHELEEAAAVLRAGHERRLDLLDAGVDGWVVNAVHVGIGVAAAERATPLKPALGDAAYPLGALLEGVATVSLDVEVAVDGETLDLAGPALLVLVANGRTIGGGHALAPDADPSDGLLDVVVALEAGAAARAAFGAAVLAGTHLERDDVVHVRGTRVELAVAGSALRINTDGELVDAVGDRLAVQLRPHALRVVVPR